MQDNKVVAQSLLHDFFEKKVQDAKEKIDKMIQKMEKSADDADKRLEVNQIFPIYLTTKHFIPGIIKNSLM